MTSLMLPAAPKDVGRLSDVFISALASVGGGVENRLRLANVRHSVVILVDGLGYENLRKTPSYARFLNQQNIQSFRCEFPSTTATSITGFATGVRSSEHGMIGYSVFDRTKNEAKNLLSGWASQTHAGDFRLTKPISAEATGIQINAVGPKAYERSGFTKITMDGANYLSGETMAERFEALDRILSGPGPSLTYLYIPELDQAAHKFGVESTAWLHLLDEFDLIVSRFVSKMGANVGALITADHGVIDVPQANHVHLDDFGWYQAMVLHTAGDPRCNFIYLKGVEKAAEFLELANREFGTRAYVCVPEDLEQSGWTGTANELVRRFLPDIYLIWKDYQVAYDRRFAKSSHLKMIGQHGGISDTETRVPFIKLGKY